MSVAKEVVRKKDVPQWVPWTIKRGRPDKVPGFQDLSQHPPLEEGQKSCQEGQHCFYFSCPKCVSLLALETYNPSYRSKVEYIPTISNIKGPNDVFEEDNKYHGEVHELYFFYFARIPSLTGIAVHGWSSNDAESLFYSVKQTFRHIKKYNDKNTETFEIDWLYFSGSTVTIIEVKEKSEKGNSNQNFGKKMEQIRKDGIIMMHLLGAVGCQDIKVNYVIACPNVSIREVNGKFLARHKDTIGEIIGSGGHIAFISEECMSRDQIYEYHPSRGELELGKFSVFTRSNVAGDHMWDTKYSQITSTVVLSKLLLGSPNEIKHPTDHPLLRNNPSLLDQEQETEMRNQKKREFKPAEVLHNFPDCLILGPQQLEIINSDSNKSVIIGEVGTGKTMVILALLYKYTAKCLSQSDNPEYKNVLLLIPDAREEFRKYVTNFIQQHCNEEYINFPSNRITVDEKFLSGNKIEVILADEFHKCLVLDVAIPSFTTEICLSRPSMKICITFTSPLGYPRRRVIRTTITYQRDLFNEFQRFELHHMYRNPVNIATRLSKIKRGIGRLPSLILPLKLGVTVMQEDSIEIKPFSTIEEIETAIPRKRFKNERMLAVTYNLPLQLPMTVLEEYDCVTELYEYLRFLGVQYHSVTVIYGKSDRCEFENISHASISSETVQAFFHAISRVISRLVIICHKKEEKYFHDLLKLGPVDTLVLEKLRREQKVEPEDYPLLKTDEDKFAALSILIQTNNTEQYKEMQTKSRSNSVVFGDAFLKRRIRGYFCSPEFMQRIIIFFKAAGYPRVLDPAIEKFVKDEFSLVSPNGTPVVYIRPSYRENFSCLIDVIPGVNDWGSLIAYAVLSRQIGDNEMLRICVLEALRLLAIMKEVFDKLIKRTCSKMYSKQKTSGASLHTIKKCYKIGQKLLKFRIAAESLPYIGDAERLVYYERKEKELYETCCRNFLPTERRFLRQILSTAEKRKIVFTTEAQRESFDLIVTMLQSILRRMKIPSRKFTQSSTYKDDTFYHVIINQETSKNEQEDNCLSGVFAEKKVIEIEAFLNDPLDGFLSPRPLEEEEDEEKEEEQQQDEEEDHEKEEEREVLNEQISKNRMLFLMVLVIMIIFGRVIEVLIN